MEVGVTISPNFLLQNELFTFVVTSCYTTIFKLHFCKCYIVKVKYFSIELYLLVFILLMLFYFGQTPYERQ